MRLGFFKSDELNFVEFNITGDDYNFQKLSQESYYLSSEVFNLFVSCFEKSNELYEYFEPTKYNARKIVILRNELLNYYENIVRINDYNTFIEYLDNLFLGKAFINSLENLDLNWKNHWKKYHTDLLNINKEMISIVEKCIDEVRILWIIGY